MAINLMELLSEFSIDATKVLTGDLTILAEMRTQYEELVTEVRSSVTATDTQLASALNSAKSDDELVKLAKQVQSDIWEIIFPAIDENPLVAVLLFENLKEVNGVVKYERDFHLNGQKLTSNTVAAMPDTEKQEKASRLGSTIRSLIEQFRSLGVSEDAFAAVENFPGSISEKSGKFVPTMSKLRTESENSSAGRPVTGSKLRFNWNGDDLPEKTTPNDVAHNFISDRKAGYIVKWSTVVDMVKKSGQTVTDGFTLEIPERGTLIATVPEETVSE